MLDLSNFAGFQWDKGNQDKNWVVHQVSNSECEEVFFRAPLVLPDIKHSKKEERYYALGKTSQHRTLFISFTLRENFIRVISARDANKKERQHYETHEKNSTI